MKIFDKKVTLESFAIYWKPKATLYSKNIGQYDEDNVDELFDENIGTKIKPVSKLKYLVGPIRYGLKFQNQIKKGPFPPSLWGYFVMLPIYFKIKPGF